MASGPKTTRFTAARPSFNNADDEDDDEYGGDFDDYDTQALTEHVSSISLRSPSPEVTLYPAITTPPSIEDRSNAASDSITNTEYQSKRKARLDTPEIEVEWESDGDHPPADVASEQLRPIQENITTGDLVDVELDPVAAAKADQRSPLERFRARRSLSVTDLTAPTWCELQYFYSLAKWGRPRRTEAMKSGTEVHRVLEEQVHRIVKVETETKEDRMGMRIWNIIQGLQSLRQTGLARELEVWAVLDGQFVVGVIDELSYICPDHELEELSIKRAGKKAAPKLPHDQTTITEFLMRPENLGLIAEKSRDQRRAQGDGSKIYISDTKTRAKPTMPPQGKANRTTLLQLMLYRHMLCNMAELGIEGSQLWQQFRVDPTAVFSDKFIAQVGGMNEIFYDAEPESSNVGSSQETGAFGSLDMLLQHNTLEKLWGLCQSYFSLVFPSGKDSIGEVMKVDYRSSKDGQMIGAKAFLYEEEMVEAHIEFEMLWWRGHREAQGVEVDEAFKCGFCDFYDGCEWRKDKVENQIEKTRLKKVGLGRKSLV